ncbi:MAG: 6-phosphogluconolactonase [Chlamydiales bacterium]
MRMKQNHIIHSFDERRDFVIPGDRQATVQFSTDHFIDCAQEAISQRGFFCVALSGGSTPKAIFHKLCEASNRTKIDWNKVKLFWSDERAVPEDHPDSNYKMAMDAGFAELKIPKSQIFKMNGVGDLEKNALEYDEVIRREIPDLVFDLIMLGMGEDGHTASLFPKTHALHVKQRLSVANYIPEKKIWRMTMTYECINNARNIAIYVLGSEKANTVSEVLSANPSCDTETFPVQGVGTAKHRALWILDHDAAINLIH